MTITFETVIVAGIAMGAATGVVGLVGYDLMHSPTPHSRYIEAGAAPGQAAARPLSTPALNRSTDQSKLSRGKRASSTILPISPYFASSLPGWMVASTA